MYARHEYDEGHERGYDDDVARHDETDDGDKEPTSIICSIFACSWMIVRLSRLVLLLTQV